MPNSDNRPAGVGIRAAALIILGLVGCLFAQQEAYAQTTAANRYENTRDQERLVSSSPAATADDLRFVVDRYWRIVRAYPATGYADNALWQGGNLSLEAFRRFSQDSDKARAIRLFEWLKQQYPHSSLASAATTQIEQLSMPPTGDATIRAVHRQVLPEVVRVTVEMDREVSFSQERLGNPSRLFFDLKGTKTVPTLQDAVLRYDTDAVREIRFGRHANNTIRMVVDLENIGRYSVFTLYEPYRIVIDCERDAPHRPASQVASTSGSTSHVIIASSPSVPIAPSASVASPASPAPHAPVAPHGTVAVPAPVAPPAPHAPVAPVAPPATPSPLLSGKFSVARQLGLGVSRIVIDPGHGGHDPGASAFSISEAELVLDVSLRLEALLQQQPGIEVVLTRRTNDYLSLEERTNIANRESADLFLSIHANASATPTARGVETYFLSFALNRQAEAVAARENAASGKTMSSLPGIIKAITLNSKLNESRDFAALIQRSLIRGLTPSNRGLKDLGVKQAPFMVLIGAAMPSVLAEISFVTNRQDARLLKSAAYREKIAQSLLNGILKYQQALKKVQTAALN
jgi:N-acetylmuramoyl-L-alanine amidase